MKFTQTKIAEVLQMKKIFTFNSSKITMMLVMTLLIFSLENPLLVLATNTATCSTGVGSSPKGDRMDSTSSNVWIGLSGTHQLGHSSTSSTSSCSVSTNTAQNDPTNVAFAGNGYLAFTQKGTGGSSQSCISSYNTATSTIVKTSCISGAGADDVDKDPTNSNMVWSSWYYNGYVGKFDTSLGNLSTFLPPSCGVTSNLEGLRVDSSGNVWAADEACNKLWKYVPSSNTWTSYTISGFLPWYLSIDNSASHIWITSQSNTLKALADFNISTGTAATISYPGSAQGATEVAQDPANRITFVAFQNGYVNEYYNSLGSWQCTGSGDSYSNGTPFGISYSQSGGVDYYWATLYGNSQLVVGHC
ncbi:MAG TPA: hypothetical protein VEU72_07640 [Nitrosopumilaceae archaeon]|nr:hypothetical protein [Nitrosopumilaceae archaeon]